MKRILSLALVCGLAVAVAPLSGCEEEEGTPVPGPAGAAEGPTGPVEGAAGPVETPERGPVQAD